MYTVKYYNEMRTARTASGALRQVKALPRLYGQGNRNPTVDCDTEAEADELVRLMDARRDLCCSVRVNGEAVI